MLACMRVGLFVCGGGRECVRERETENMCRHEGGGEKEKTQTVAQIIASSRHIVAPVGFVLSLFVHTKKVKKLAREKM